MPLPRRLAAALASVLAALRWLHARTVQPAGDWLTAEAGVLGAFEESSKSVAREVFAAWARWFDAGAALVLHALGGRRYRRARRRARRERAAALAAWRRGAGGTFNALVEREGLSSPERAPPPAAAADDEGPPSPRARPRRRRSRAAAAAAAAAAAPPPAGGLPRGAALFPLPAGHAAAEMLGRRGLLEDAKAGVERAIAAAYALVRRAARAALLLRDRGDAPPPPPPPPARAPSARGPARAGWGGARVWTAADVVLRAGYPLEEHSCRTGDGYVLRLHRLPRPGARDAVLFEHGVLDTALSWVSNGAAGSAAFAAHDAGFDVWLANSRANPPRLAADPSRAGGRYWRYSANELAEQDIGAQVDHIHLVKTTELAAGGARGGGADGGGGGARGGGGAGAGGAAGAAGGARALRRAASDASLLPAHRAEVRHEQLADGDGEGAGLRRALSAALPAAPGGARRGRAVPPTRAEPPRGDEPPAGGGGAAPAAPKPAVEALPYRLQAVGHSLGAACLLMYVVGRRLAGRPHRLRRLVLLSPAGVHRRMPALIRPLVVLAPAAARAWDALAPLLPRGRGAGVGLRLPTPLLRWAFFKLVADLRHLPAARDLARAAVRLALAGDASEWDAALGLPHYDAAAMPAVSLHCAAHFAQWARRDDFAFFDYGSRAANAARYGAPAPPSVSAAYGLLDVPVDLAAGRADGLIPAANVEEHHRRMRAAGAAASLSSFAGGHLDFSFGVNVEISDWILSRLNVERAAVG